MRTQTSTNFADPVSNGVQVVKVEPDRAGQRVDNFLAGRLKGVPRSLVYRILRTGQVRINGRRAKPDTRLEAGDEVRIPPVRTAQRDDPGTASNWCIDWTGTPVAYSCLPASARP